MKTILLVLWVGVLAQTVCAELAYNAEFDTSGDMEGWTASAAVVGMKQATAVGTGGEGVLTSVNLQSTYPVFQYGTIALPAGESWAKLEIRIRQLNVDPPSGNPKVFNNAAVRLELATSADWHVRMETGATQNYAGYVGTPYASDMYAMTVTPQADNWMLVTVDFSNAPYLKSHDIPQINIIPTRDANDNIEIDSVRLYDTSVEPRIRLIIFSR